MRKHLTWISALVVALVMSNCTIITRSAPIYPTGYYVDDSPYWGNSYNSDYILNTSNYYGNPAYNQL